MIKASLMEALLDSMKDPVMFVDVDNVIRYMNKAAVANYEEGAALLGRSVLECHNEESNGQITEILSAMHAGEDERLITDDKKHRIYMRVVRDEEGEVLGYYERYEPPTK